MAAYAALSSLSQTIHTYTNQAKSLISVGTEENIRSIHEYVVFLLSFLQDFSKKAYSWEDKMRDVAHETEDIIEHFMWQQSFFRRVKLSIVKFANQLNEVREKIWLITGDIMDERIAYTPDPVSPSNFPPVGNGPLIGMEGDLTALKDRLCGLSSKLQAIAILGMGGIGKTTLARTLYADSLIIEYFHIRVWLTILQDYSAHKVLADLVDSMNLMQEQTFRQEIDDLTRATKIYQNLKSMRYLIVMDDIWNIKVLDDVRNIFPDDGNGSRIVLTTRLGDVAIYSDSISPPHEMKLMNDSQSWDLLRQKVFSEGCCPPDLDDVGKEIARRCAGLPLGVVLISGILSQINRTRSSWEEISRNVNTIVDREIEQILSLSYAYLPHHLRPCFLLFGGFKEDVTIHTSRLFRLWIAESFVMKHRTRRSKSLEEEAEEYLEDLVKRNLVIVTTRKSDGKIRSCSLHDMVRGMCIRKGIEEKFLHFMDGPGIPQCMMNERRITIRTHSDHINKFWSTTIRTILCFQSQKFPVLGSHKLVRVLDALGVDLKDIPSEVFDLYHIRYLALMGPLRIPSAISNLANLQILIIHLASGKLRGRYDINGASRSLPLEIWRLPQLRHLYFCAPYILPHPPEGVDIPLENLQTVSLVANLVWSEKILQMIPNIKRLGLTYTINQEYELHHLIDLHQLEKLEVIGYLNFTWGVQYPSFPCTLKKLTLVGGEFPWQDMSIVGSLPNLEVLKLLDNSCNGETWETRDGDFPRLKYLLIDGSDLQQWRTQINPLPTLERLVLHSCRLLREIPEDVGEIPTLELIEVDYCTKSLVESAKKIKEVQDSYGNYALRVHAGFEEIQSFYKGIDLSPSTPATIGNDAVIGLDDDVMEIKEQLCGQSTELQVVSVVGMAGIGKTTLARLVYNDPLILEHFEVCIWLTVSSDYSPQKSGRILISVVDSIKSLEEQLYGEENEESEMATKTYPYVKDRRYLVVMDNVRSTEVWEGLRKLFPDDGNRSRIMLTTRVAYIGLYANSGTPPHWMMFMEDYQSWDLLKQKVFKNSNCPPYLETQGQRIARKCEGLPLAVVLIAGVLSAAGKTGASYWNKIAKRVNGRDLEKILSLSYSQLPRHLRPCLLYMGAFPEDESIHASKLIKSWIAEGYLKHEDGCSKSTVEEKAEEYLEDLAKRNLVVVTSRKSNRKIKSCSLHDLVQGLCIKKGREATTKIISILSSERTSSSR